MIFFCKRLKFVKFFTFSDGSCLVVVQLLTILPKIKNGQQCEIILNELTQDRTEYRKDFSDEITNALQNTYFVDKPDKIIPSNKKYLVRVKVDNLFSQLSDDYNGPNVEI